MPDWRVTGKDARYGQHAVRLDKRHFESLIEQLADKQLQPVYATFRSEQHHRMPGYCGVCWLACAGCCQALYSLDGRSVLV